MLDFVIFFILPVHMMVILPVVFRPAHPGFSLSDENEGLDCSFLGNLHDDSPVDDVSICEGVSAVDGIVFNREICNCHPPPTEITKGNEPGSNCSLTKPAKLLKLVFVKHPTLVQPVQQPETTD